MDLFLWSLFSYYIFIGTCQVLLMKASGKSAKGTGNALAYNTASAMMLIELAKWLICLVMERLQGDEARKEKGETRKSTTCWGFMFYAVPGFLYAVENNLKIPATVYLHPHVFALFNNSKVVFAAIGMVVLLGKKFSVLQWVSMSLLVMSLCVAEVKMLLPMPEACEQAEDSAGADSKNAPPRRTQLENNHDFLANNITSPEAPLFEVGPGTSLMSIAVAASAAKVAPMLKALLPNVAASPELITGGADDFLPFEHPRLLSELPAGSTDAGLFLLGIVLVFAASMISGLAGVFNELLLKKRDSDVSVWRKNIWTYQWGVIFNSVGLLSSTLFGKGAGTPGGNSATGSSPLDYVFHGFDVWVWAMVFVTALLGISVSLIMKYFDNVVKCFGGSLILYTTTIASMILFGSKVDAGFVLGLMVYSVSSYFYAGDHNKRLDTYLQHEDEIETLVKQKSREGKTPSQLVSINSAMNATDEEADIDNGSASTAIVVGRPTGAE